MGDASGYDSPHVMMSHLRFICVFALNIWVSMTPLNGVFCRDRKSAQPANIYVPFSPSVVNFQPPLLNYACFPAPTL